MANSLITFDNMPPSGPETNRADRIAAGTYRGPEYEEHTEEQILAYIEEQKLRGVSRKNLRLPCGEPMIVERLDTFGEEHETFKPMFDHPEFEFNWEYSEAAVQDDPGLAETTNYHWRPWIGRRTRR